MYNCLPFGLLTAPWVFSKVMRELAMHWRRGGICVLPYLDDFMFMERGMERNFFLAGLKINMPKCHSIPPQR